MQRIAKKPAKQPYMKLALTKRKTLRELHCHQWIS